MQIKQNKLQVATNGRSLIEITQLIKHEVANCSIQTGLCHIYLQHTSASLIINENADPSVLQDLEIFMQRLIPDSSNMYLHNAEGADDMPAHIRSILTQTFLTIPVANKVLSLGVWQGVYLWEHRYQKHEREIVISIIGA
jgi:secondary thiamine-phosphate synthase enzyme